MVDLWLIGFGLWFLILQNRHVSRSAVVHILKWSDLWFGWEIEIFPGANDLVQPPKTVMFFWTARFAYNFWILSIECWLCSTLKERTPTHSQHTLHWKQEANTQDKKVLPVKSTYFLLDSAGRSEELCLIFRTSLYWKRWSLDEDAVLPAVILCLLFGSSESLQELRMQKLKVLLVRTQNFNILPLKPGVGQYIAMHATLTARDFFLANFYSFSPFTCIFSKT